MNDDRDLQTRLEQMVDNYVSSKPVPGMTPLAHKIKVFSQIADISSRLTLKYESGGSNEKDPSAAALPQH